MHPRWRCWPTTKRRSARRSSISAAARHPSRPSPAARSSISTRSRSAATTSRSTWRAALNVRLSAAERLKTLYGSAISSPSDDRETIAVEQVGDEAGQPNHIRAPNSCASFARASGDPRTRPRPASRAGTPTHPGSRIVLTGGACQLTGLPETARRILGGQVRIGRPSASGPARIRQEPVLCGGGRSSRLSADGRALEHFEPSRERVGVAVGGDGYLARVGRWLKESF